MLSTELATSQPRLACILKTTVPVDWFNGSGENLNFLTNCPVDQSLRTMKFSREDIQGTKLKKLRGHSEKNRSGYREMPGIFLTSKCQTLEA